MVPVSPITIASVNAVFITAASIILTTTSIL